MLSAQLHYPVFMHEYRTQASQNAPIAKRDIRRVSQLTGQRTSRREARGR